jgi:hypothetical protein
MHELKRLKITELKALYRRPLPGALERKELIQMLIDEEKVDVIPSPEPVEYQLNMLKSMKIRQLKGVMEEAGVFYRPEDVVEKNDMITIFKNSGRLIILPPMDEPVEEPPQPTLSTHDERTPQKPSSATDDATASAHMQRSTMPSDDDASVMESVTGYPGHRPTVETVAEDSEAEEDEEFVRVSAPEVLFRQQEEEFNGEQQTQEASTGSQTPAPPSDPPPSSPAFAEAEPSPLSSQGHNVARVSDVEDSTANARFVRTDQGEPLTCSSSPEPMDIESEDEFTGDGQPQDLSATFQHYTIAHLQDLARDLDIDLSSCFERCEMVDLLVNHGITGNYDPNALSRAMFTSWSVSQIRAVASEIQIDLSQCHNRDAMIDRILQTANNERTFLRQYIRSLSPLSRKSLSELRSIARELHVDISDCLEKDEIIARLICRGTSMGVC